MKVKNMTSNRGNTIANQFEIVAIEKVWNKDTKKYQKVTVEYFQSYDSVIVRRPYCINSVIELDANTWDYSVTTGKYRNQFLNETKKETQAKIDSGEYKLVNLN